MKPRRTYNALKRELGSIVGDGRPATEIADVVQELYVKVGELDLPDNPSDEFRWRMADQMTRSSVRITRDGRLRMGDG